MLENMSLQVKAHAPLQEATQLAANQSEEGESSERLNLDPASALNMENYKVQLSDGKVDRFSGCSLNL